MQFLAMACDGCDSLLEDLRRYTRQAASSMMHFGRASCRPRNPCIALPSMLATLPLRHSTCHALPSLRLHPISPRTFTRQRHGARAGTGAFRLLGRTAREGDLEGAMRLGGGCSAAQALAAIVHEGRADKEEGRGRE